MSRFSRLFRKGKKEKKIADDEKTLSEGNVKKESDGIGKSYPSDLPPEREEEMINWLASQIVKRGLETPAILFLESIKPVSFVGSQLTMLYAAPFLEILGIRGYDWASFFSKRENVESLLQKIEENVKTSEQKASQKKNRKPTIPSGV